MVRDKNVVDIGEGRWLPTFVRDDREAVKSVIDGLSDLLANMEATLIQEKYGISVMFDQAKLHYEARDPRGYFLVYGNTPAAAIFLWDGAREEAEGKKR